MAETVFCFGHWFFEFRICLAAGRRVCFLVLVICDFFCDLTIEIWNFSQLIILHSIPDVSHVSVIDFSNLFVFWCLEFVISSGVCLLFVISPSLLLLQLV